MKPILKQKGKVIRDLSAGVSKIPLCAKGLEQKMTTNHIMKHTNIHFFLSNSTVLSQTKTASHPLSITLSIKITVHS